MSDISFFSEFYNGAGVAPWIVIVGMATVTAATRFAGYWALGRRRLSARMESILSAVPASVLTAIVAPMVLATGFAESLAALVTIALAWRFPTLVAIAGGVGSVVLLRYLV
jgi:uncharacterized membrane protein